MNPRLEAVFGPYLIRTSEGYLAKDGTPLPADSVALAMAEELVEADPELHAGEIVQMMKPFCARFDAHGVERELRNLGKKPGSRPSKSGESTGSGSDFAPGSAGAAHVAPSGRQGPRRFAR